MKRLSSSIALLGAFLALSITACDSDTGPEPGVKSITVTPAEVTMNVDDVVNFSADVEVTGDASKDVNWSTSNASVVTINNDGVATGQSEGTATVTATAAADNSKKASASVKVVAPDPAQISISEYRAVSAQESDNDGPVPSPDTVGTHCCADNAGLDDLPSLLLDDFEFFLPKGQFTILEMDVQVDAAGRDVRRVEMLINGQVVDAQEITAAGGSQAAGSNVLTYTLSKNTLDFSGGNKQGGVVEPDIPNDNDAQISARVKFANGETKTVTLDNKIAIKNHQQVILFDKELPPTKLDEENERWWGGPDSEATFGITVVDHMDVGASEIKVVNFCERKFDSGGVLGPGFDQGAGHGAPVTTMVDDGFMWSLTSEANSWAFEDEGNKGVSGFYCPVPIRFLDAEGEEWSGHDHIDMDRIMLDIAFTQELAHPHPKIPEGLSNFGFLALDWRPPTCGIDEREGTEGPFGGTFLDIHVAQSAGPPSPYTDGDYGFSPDLLIANADLWYNTGTFVAGVGDGNSFGVGLKDKQFDAFRPFAEYPDGDVAELFEDVTGPGDLPERMRDLGVDLVSTSDLLDNENPDPMCGPNGPFGTDHTAPEFRDVDPDPEQFDMMVLRADVPSGEDAKDFMPMFEVFDPELGDRTADLPDKPGSGVNHTSGFRPEVELRITNVGTGATFGPFTPTDGTGFTGGPSTDFDQDANDDDTDGDYFIDLGGFVAPDAAYDLTVAAPDFAIHPNVGMLMFPTIKFDETDPSVTRIDPPQDRTESSDARLIFTIEGEITDNFGLSSVRVEVRDPTDGGTEPDSCDPDDALLPVGTGPGMVTPDNVIEQLPLDAEDRFSQEVTIQNAAPGSGPGVDQHVCFYIVADDDARNYEGELFPHSSNAFTHTDIDWR